MARPDGRIEKGQRLSSAISARAWNRAQEAADRVLGAQPGVSGDGVSGTSAPYTWVYARNDTGATVNRWGVMAITGVAITPTATPGGATAQFERLPTLTIGDQTGTTTGWCVAVEPIESGKLGRVAIAGAVQVKVADLPKAARSAVLWKDSNWAIILINPGTRLGTISANWSKGQTATVTEQNGDGTAISGNPTFTAKNYFADVTVPSGTRRVACAQIGSTWVLIAAEC